MDCSNFVTKYTDYRDGSASAEVVRRMQEHLSGCESCRRYEAVVEHGASLLRSLPPPELCEDFQPRLQHRLYNDREKRFISGLPTSRAPAFAIVGIAALLTVVAWASLLLGGTTVVRLEPIVVDRAPAVTKVRPMSSSADEMVNEEPPEELGSDLWHDARVYDYSPLFRRYENQLRNRPVGLEAGR